MTEVISEGTRCFCRVCKRKKWRVRATATSFGVQGIAFANVGLKVAVHYKTSCEVALVPCVRRIIVLQRKILVALLRTKPVSPAVSI